jgi:hypothetical protein
MPDKKAHTHPDFAVKVMGKIPPELRKSVELKKGSGEYTILKVRGRSVASIRDGSCRIVHPHDGSATAAASLAKLIADAAPVTEPTRNATPRTQRGVEAA